jgi:serine/threonine protein kinase
MVQSVSSLSSALGNRYVIQSQTKQRPTRGNYFAKDTLNGDLCIVQEISTTSVTQADIYCQHLQKEAKNLSRLAHPQIEKVRDCFVQETSVLIVKDQVIGKPYSEVLEKKGKFTEEETTLFLKSVLSLLVPLHRKGVKHCNLSPTTIYLQTADELPSLTQFGFLQDVLVESGMHNEPGLQTQAFDLTGLAISKGINEDLYCLALTAIILFTGQPLTTLFNFQTQSWDWEDYQLATDDFSQAINRMLSPQTDERFTSAGEFLSAISGSTSISLASSSAPLPGQRASIRPTATSQAVTAPTASAAIQQPQQNKLWLSLIGSGIALALLGWLWVTFHDNNSQNTLTALPTTTTATDVGSNNDRSSSSSFSGFSSGRNGNSQDSPSTQANPVNETSTVYSSEPSTTTMPIVAPLTESEAVALIENWLKAKAQIFAAPFDENLASELTTGTLYYDITKPDGSIDWLQDNDAYYTFGVQKVEPTGKFSVSGSKAEITTNITEDRTLYSKGRRDANDSELRRSTVRYDLVLENGTWKIEDYE